MLEKVKEWKTVQDPIIRIGITKEIGVLQKQVEEASTALQTAITPYRYKVDTTRVETFIQYGIKNEKEMILSILQSYPITLQERAFIEEKTA